MSEADRAKSLTRRQFGAIAGFAGLTAAVGACASSDSSGSDTRTKAETTNATLVLDVSPYGKHTPFYVAQEKNFWANRGLEVSIQPGGGSADTISKIAAGAGEFGFADTSTLILARANDGIKAKLVCMYHYKNLMSAQSLVESDIREPKDLVGKNMITTAGNAGLALLPGLGDLNSFDSTKVEITTAQYTAEVPAVVGGQVDGSLDYYTGFPALEAAAHEAGKKATAFLYADYGLDMYNNGILVSEETLNTSPERVRAFTAGFVEAVLWTVANPDEAVEIFRNQVPGLGAEIIRAQQQIAIDHLNTPEVSQNGFGPMDEGMVVHTLELVNKYFETKDPVRDVGDLYTNEFVPRGEVPAFN